MQKAITGKQPVWPVIKRKSKSKGDYKIHVICYIQVELIYILFAVFYYVKSLNPNTFAQLIIILTLHF